MERELRPLHRPFQVELAGEGGHLLRTHRVAHGMAQAGIVEEGGDAWVQVVAGLDQPDLLRALPPLPLDGGVAGELDAVAVGHESFGTGAHPCGPLLDPGGYLLGRVPQLGHLAG